MADPGYLFEQPPPASPRLWFPEKTLTTIAIWGTCSCPYTPPQYTIFPGNGQVGRWKLRRDPPPRPLSPESISQPWKFLKDELPGMRMHYEDFETGNTSIWVLTDQLQYGIWCSQGKLDFRLGMWPD